MPVQMPVQMPVFQFTPLREGRPEGRACCRCTTRFQFTPLREGRRYRALLESPGNKFQFTPLREGRPTTTNPITRRNISIHAPPRGATQGGERQVADKIFQFTPLREGRRKKSAPSRSPAMYFNSRPSARGDGIWLNACFASRRFQFTPLREGRRSTDCTPVSTFPFQFTPLREGRRKGEHGVVVCPISIHAPPRGATFHPGLQFFVPYFNSRPSARGDDCG